MQVAGRAKRIGVTPKEIDVRPMEQKWESYSLLGPAKFSSESIVHQLLHLKVPNDGKLPKSLLRAYLGTRHSRAAEHNWHTAARR